MTKKAPDLEQVHQALLKPLPPAHVEVEICRADELGPQAGAKETTEKPTPSKPASMSKKDVMAFVRQSFDESIAKVSKLTPAQITQSYPGFGEPMSGLELLMFVLDHTTHHRASAEMYLRAKGITPAEYQF